jgi:hypothetical protein
MRYLSPFRIASYLLLFIFVGHTGGAMIAQRSRGAASDAVFALMKSVHFDFNGADATWYGFWFGFGLTISVYLLFSAVLAWQLDKIEPEQWPAVQVIAWAFIASQFASAILSFEYFFLGPALASALITALLIVGTLRKQKAPKRAPA